MRRWVERQFETACITFKEQNGNVVNFQQHQSIKVKLATDQAVSVLCTSTVTWDISTSSKVYTQQSNRIQAGQLPL